MPTRSLPLRPNLDQLKSQAHELHRAHGARDRSAAARVAAHHPQMRGLTFEAVLDRAFALADAQLVVAREYGFTSWAKLKHHVALADVLSKFRPHPRFEEAVAAIDVGDLDRLRALLMADRSLVHARTNLDPPYHYFTGATLLHHVAGNPDRGRLEGRLPPLPGNIADLARLLLESGADVNARTVGPNGGDTMGLVLTSKQASDADVAGPLIDVLLEYGAKLDLTSDACLDASLANHAPRAAEKLIALGAQPDLLAAAALGRMDLLRTFFDATGKLRSLPRRRGTALTDRDAIGLALLYAYAREQRDAVDFLLEHDGNWNMTGVNNGTVLHRAAFAGDLAIVERLIARGADIANRDNPFHSTPLGWADHNQQGHVVEWMRRHCAIDLHDAASFDFREHIEARLREDPASIDRRLDHGDIPASTPLHAAADWHRVEAARILLERGADPNALAGNGLTPLDVADRGGASEVAELLERHGAVRRERRRSSKSHNSQEARATGGNRSDGEGAHTTPAPNTALEPFNRITGDIVDAYRSGDPGAIRRIGEFFGEWFTWERLRANLQRMLDKSRDAEVSLDEVQALFARQRGFESWAAFAESVTRQDNRARTWALPLYHVDESRRMLEVRHDASDQDWDAIASVIADRRLTALDARGRMTDRGLSRIAEIKHITRLGLGGSKRVTDDGLQHLARMPQLEELDLSDYPGGRITDRGLEVLCHLPALRRFAMCWQTGISDAGVANLAGCDQLEAVNLLGTATGDGAIAALAGKRRLARFTTGRQATDAGLPLLHRFPLFTSWQNGRVDYSLMSPEAGPTHLVLDGPVTRDGVRSLVGLDGLFGLSFFWHTSALAPDALGVLRDLPHLGFLGCDGKVCNDEAMRHIAALPHLRMLMAQGTVATDDGFEALSGSQMIEYIWGRECPNLTDRGFVALAAMPALAGLAVSCKHVEQTALAALPRFPALRELMPMDVSDEGFQHVGRCARLERLWCMYCRDTTDVATEHIAGLASLKTYYAGATKITDRSLEMLGRMASLERLEFWSCTRITNAGAQQLARLPRLREVTFDDCAHVTADAAPLFPPHVRVRIS